MKQLSFFKPRYYLLLPVLLLLLTGLARGQSTCCNGCAVSPAELVINGNFSNPACNIDYTSSLLSQCGQTFNTWNAYTELPYIYTNNGLIDVWVASEHTGTAGSKAMVIDGPTTPGWQSVWQQNQVVNVQAGKKYCFSAWVRNICIPCGNPPSFRLEIIQGGMLLPLGAINAVAYTQGWVQLCSVYEAPVSGTLQLQVAMAGNTNIGGNDAMIDDISFREMLPPQADFDWRTPIECGKIQFIGASQGVTHSWTFTHNNILAGTSGQANPVFEYGNLTGQLTVAHTVSNACGTATITKTINLPPYSPPHAGFSWYKPIECGKPIRFYAYEQEYSHSWTVTNNNNVVGTGTNYEYNFDFTGLSGQLFISHTISNSCGSATIKDTLDLPACDSCCKCESLFNVSKKRVYPPGMPPGCCCCYSFTFDKGCLDVYGIVSNAPTIQIPLSSNKIKNGTRIGTMICVNAGQTKDITLYFLNRCGDTICSQIHKLDCPPQPPTCCDKIQGQLLSVSTTDPLCVCKYNVIASFTDTACRFKSIFVTTGTGTVFTQTLFSFSGLAPAASYKVGELCVQSGLSAICPPTASGGCYIPVYVKICFITEKGDTCCKELRDTCWLPVIVTGGGGGITLRSGKPGAITAKTGAMLELFPNPAKTSLTVKVAAAARPGNGSINILSAGGVLVKRVFLKLPPHQFTVDLNGFKPGAYFVQFTGGDGQTYRSSFVKE